MFVDWQIVKIDPLELPQRENLRNSICHKVSVVFLKNSRPIEPPVAWVSLRNLPIIFSRRKIEMWNTNYHANTNSRSVHFYVHVRGAFPIGNKRGKKIKPMFSHKGEFATVKKEWRKRVQFLVRTTLYMSWVLFLCHGGCSLVSFRFVCPSVRRESKPSSLTLCIASSPDRSKSRAPCCAADWYWGLLRSWFASLPSNRRPDRTRPVTNHFFFISISRDTKFFSSTSACLILVARWLGQILSLRNIPPGRGNQSFGLIDI